MSKLISRVVSGIDKRLSSFSSGSHSVGHFPASINIARLCE